MSYRKPQSAIMALGLILSLMLTAGPFASGQGAAVVNVSEGSLRKMATKKVLPEFPSESKRRGVQGVAVVVLEFDERGQVSHLEVLEAPDSHIAEAVPTAVKQWRFQPTTIKGGPPVHIRGKLTFYFLLDGKGAGRVENPKQFN